MDSHSIPAYIHVGCNSSKTYAIILVNMNNIFKKINKKEIVLNQ